MNAENLELARSFVDASYISQGGEELNRRACLVRALLTQRRLPDDGWPDAAIESFVRELSAMDSNNFSGAVGVGEREGRVWSALVRARHWGFAHGMGRSGDIAATQPKAAGSSLLVALTNALALSAVRECGMTSTAAALVLPLATGASIALVLSALRARRRGASIVVWSRIDQKSAFKCIAAAGARAVVVPLRIAADGDSLVTDVDAVRAAVELAGAENVLAVLTTTSCFAPRAPDDVRAVGRLCAELDVPHVVNNAYGLQSGRICGVLNEACVGWPPRRNQEQRRMAAAAAATAVGGDDGARADGASTAHGDGVDAGEGAAAREGETAITASTSAAVDRAVNAGGGAAVPSRVDAWISSTDKNFLVPVGGAIVGSTDAELITAIAQTYPGRASSGPLVDLFVTLLGMGVRGLRELLAERARAYDALLAGLGRVAARAGERVLRSPHNPISLSLTLSALTAGAPPTRGPSYLGSLLFSRGVSGTRVVAPGARATIDGHAFTGWGAQTDAYPHGAYLTAAAAIGIKESDVPVFEARIEKAIAAYKKQRAKGEAAATGAPAATTTAVQP